MRDFFDVSWDDLSLAHVERFLADAGDEGINWEAKAEQPDAGGGAGRRLRVESVRKAVCGFANQLGGVLILGADSVSAEQLLLLRRAGHIPRPCRGRKRSIPVNPASGNGVRQLSLTGLGSVQHAHPAVARAIRCFPDLGLAVIIGWLMSEG
jgi:hypothetical protein